MTWWSIEVGLSGADGGAVATRLVVETGHAVEEPAASVVGFAAEADWSLKWRDGLRVRQIGRLAGGPSWLLDPGPTAVVIDPETAFGTGEHGSTRGALRLLDRHLPSGGLVLDLGNAVRNGVADRVRFVAGDARILAPLAGPVALVVANILRTENQTLLDPIRGALAPGGIAVFAGMEDNEAPLFAAMLGERGYRIVGEHSDEGWWSAATTRLQ